MGPSQWVFLGESGDLRDIGWVGKQRSHLWRYNQHYFDDLNALGAEVRSTWHETLVHRWILDNQAGHGVGWEPYPTSIRITNWIKWAAGGKCIHPNIAHNLAIQVRWLAKRLEYHLLGNHLLSNAKALVMAGLFFEGDEANEWLAKGLRILDHEIREQVLEDGGHFERSTMYHALAFEDILDLINASQCYNNRLSTDQRTQVSQWPRLARNMHSWLLAMCHPDGDISFFNDAAFDIAPSVPELDAYAHRLLGRDVTEARESITHLKQSGYFRIDHDNAIALLDVAPVGPDYLPGHAHADTLSFELSVNKSRVLVNSGTSCYEESAERLRQRGTAAHNTVIVNGENSTEVWSAFRVARRARPVSLESEDSALEHCVVVQCAHDGYTREPGKPIHRRTWTFAASSLKVTDEILGQHKTAAARFHFHPSVQVHINSVRTGGNINLPDGTIMAWQLEHGEAALEEATWHQRFGETQQNVCLVINLVNGVSVIRFDWGIEAKPHDYS